MSKIAVIGVGNLLMGDDGIGIYVAKALMQEELPKNVRVYDCATRGFEVLECIEGYHKAIIVDACKKGGIPGSVYRFVFDPKDDIILSMHDISFIDAIKAGMEIYALPHEIIIIGIEPDTLEWNIGLSSKLRDAFPNIMNAVRSEFK